jgi:IclR family transcriptional regulator, mhp operon transcriptional activator
MSARPPPSDNDAAYKEVRGLSRGLAVLRTLNRLPGGIASTSEIARDSGIHRTTTKRLLETLRAEGLVEVGERAGEYRLAREVQQLSDGYVEEDWITKVAAPMLAAAAPSLVWPCNVATLEGCMVVIRASTHRRSPLAHQHALLGTRLPVLPTSLGRAMLAAMDEATLAEVQANLRSRAKELRISKDELARLPTLMAETRRRGYAHTADVPDARFAGVAVPIRCGQRVLGAVNLVLTKNAQSQDLIQSRYVAQLSTLARDIGVYAQPWLR